VDLCAKSSGEEYLPEDQVSDRNKDEPRLVQPWGLISEFRVPRSFRLTFRGASLGVTGSCFQLDNGRSEILVDCGMFQGSKTEKELNYRAFPFDPRSIHAVLLTHAHIDHSGLLPKLTKAGFAGPILATRATVDLCAVMLPDAGHIQESEVEQLNRRNRARGIAAVQPIYTAEDAKACLAQFRPVDYQTWVPVLPGCRAQFWNAGHLLGSASVVVEMEYEPNHPPLRLLFSGDIGPGHKLMQYEPEAPEGFDHVICESTYGDMDRPEVSPVRRRELLRDEVLAAAKPNGAMLIPSFAVERTQELLVDLVSLMETGDVPVAPIFIDSPLATKASAVFEAHASELEGGEALKGALHARNVHFTDSVEQSKAIGRIRNFHIVIAASGMCDAGRIRHHLKAWLWRDDATVLFVGFQAKGTLGRILLDGASRVRIMGDEVKVRARTRSLDLYSGHADGPELADWIGNRKPITGDVFLVHGERPAIEALAARLVDAGLANSPVMPVLDQPFDLTPRRAQAVETGERSRIPSESVGAVDWHNDLSELLLDISDTVAQAADERAKQVVIRRLRRALTQNRNGR
jgi:metallo-beta-lactamase family protein